MSYLPEDPCPVVERLMRTVYAVDGCSNVASDFQIIDVIDTVAPVLLFVPENADIDCSDRLALAHGFSALHGHCRRCLHRRAGHLERRGRPQCLPWQQHPLPDLHGRGRLR